MVTQGREANILQLPIQQIFQSVGQRSILHTSGASVAPVNVPSVQATADVLQTQKTAVQQTVAVQPSATENKHLENSTSTVLVQQPTESQQQIAPNAVQNQHAESTEKSQHGSLHTPVFNSESSEVFSPSDFVEANNSSSLLLDVEGQLETEPQESLQQQVSDDIIEMIMMGKSLDDNTVLKDEDTVAPTDKVGPFSFLIR